MRVSHFPLPPRTFFFRWDSRRSHSFLPRFFQPAPSFLYWVFHSFIFPSFWITKVGHRIFSLFLRPVCAVPVLFFFVLKGALFRSFRVYHVYPFSLFFCFSRDSVFPNLDLCAHLPPSLNPFFPDGFDCGSGSVEIWPLGPNLYPPALLSFPSTAPLFQNTLGYVSCTPPSNFEDKNIHVARPF